MGAFNRQKKNIGPRADLVRHAAVAGRFYPGNPQELRRQINQLLEEAEPAAGPAPKAIIAPHAGYIYSGPIAASAYAQLAPDRDLIRRVVLLGPSHLVAVPGVAISSASAFATPLGPVPIDVEAVEQLRSLPQVKLMDDAHALEHSLEVQLPFLQVVLGQFCIVPLVTGDASPQEVAEILDRLWGGPETRLVISSDLSHYLEASFARRLDTETAQAIESLRPEDLGENQACGRVAISGLLQCAQAHGLCVRTLDLRHSGDTAGPRDQVVGYGAFSFISA